jgi:myo-inositol 2-dehydrogenase / D-chiro-inositol 1-dehydrogenase
MKPACTKNSSSTKTISAATRRDFLRTTCAIGTGVLAGAAIPYVHAGENNTIKVALVGCGGRGTGAAFNALSTTTGPVQLVAMADVFPERLAAARQNLKASRGKQVEVSDDRCFVGFDGYRKAVDALGPGGVVLLATPPAFRPIHFEYAVSKGCHVFMEKSFAVDAPGVRCVLKTGEIAKQKNLKVAGGLMSRHYLPLEEAVQQIHDGKIGEVITCWAYREHGPVGFSPKEAKMSELAQQIRNYSCFTWLNGSFLLDWLIHNLDICCWLKNAWPVSAQGQGGRQVRTAADQLFDHYAVEYSFPDGTRLFAQGRHQADCWDFFGDVIHGTKGSAVLGEGITNPRIYSGYRPVRENVLWRYKGEPCNHYQREHDLLFDAIRKDLPYNEAERCAKAAMTGILGRMAAESGREITWDAAMQSNVELAPGLEKINSLDAAAPVVPDAAGHYPIAMPGTTKVL